MTKTLVRTGIALGLAAAGWLLTASPVDAGGWAASSLDAVPAPEPDEAVAVGFTIRQHGVSPVNVSQAGLVVRGRSGDETRFEARQDGAVGHYIADVVFPAADRFTWAIDQGEFGPYELGPIDVGPAAVPAAPRPPLPAPDPDPAPLLPRLLLPVLAVAGLALVVVDRRSSKVRPAGLAAG